MSVNEGRMMIFFIIKMSRDDPRHTGKVERVPEKVCAGRKLRALHTLISGVAHHHSLCHRSNQVQCGRDSMPHGVDTQGWQPCVLPRL